MGVMTLKGLFKEAETIQYPLQSKPTPAGLKGHILNNTSQCILCGVCQKRCPTGAISVSKADHTWRIDRFHCIQCGSCSRECPKGCLSMEPGYASPSTKKFDELFEVAVVLTENKKTPLASKASPLDSLPPHGNVV